MASNHLYLVDASAYIFRAYHRLPPLTNKHGQPAGAVYGFTTMMWKLVEELNQADGPTHLAVIFDASSKTFRNDMYDQYKAHRPPPPEDLVPQFPMIRDATRAFSLACIEEEGLEADDIIACYSKAALAEAPVRKKAPSKAGAPKRAAAESGAAAASAAAGVTTRSAASCTYGAARAGPSAPRAASTSPSGSVPVRARSASAS